MAIRLVSEDIFPKMSFFPQDGQLKSQKLKNYHLVIWIHMNVGSFDSLQSKKWGKRYKRLNFCE